MIDCKDVTDLLIGAAEEEIMPRFRNVARRMKADGSFVTEADLKTQDHLIAALSQRWSDIRLLGEEMTEDEQEQLMQSDGPVWILDPLDGTSNFSAGIPYFCISLALMHEGRIQMGVVYDPNRKELFCAQEGKGATLNGEPLQLGGGDLPIAQSTALIDFKRLPPTLAERLAVNPPYASQRSFGSVALDWCWLAAGRCHLYLHGSSHLWDYGAGDLIFHEAGGYSTTLKGGLVFSNTLQKRSCVGAVEAGLFTQWCRWLDISAPGQLPAQDETTTRL